jgi:hypothetical protein
MVSKASSIVAIVVTAVIIISATIGLLYLGKPSHSQTTSSMLPTSSSVSTSNSPSSSYSGIVCSVVCTLELVQQGQGPILFSPMSTFMPKTIFPNDGPCCGGPPGAEINYTDNGNLWSLQGDIDVGGSQNGAWASADTSGLTITYNTCIYTYVSTYNTFGYICGPHHESFPPQSEGPLDSSIYGDLGTISNSASVFSIKVNLPFHNFYSSCQEDTQNNASDPFAPLNDGCSYESGIGPYDSGTLAFDVGGNYDIVSVAEVCPCTGNGNSLQISAYTSNGGVSVNKILNIETIPTFTSVHKLTVATDRRTFIDFYVDNTLVYSSSSLPIEQSPSYGAVIEFSTRTNINHEPDVVTFSNFTAYSNYTITGTKLPIGDTLEVKGPNGFMTNQTANSNGVAVVDVSAEPSNLLVSLISNGHTIATYRKPVEAGAVLQFSSNSLSGMAPFSSPRVLFSQLFQAEISIIPILATAVSYLLLRRRTKNLLIENRCIRKNFLT